MCKLMVERMVGKLRRHTSLEQDSTLITIGLTERLALRVYLVFELNGPRATE